jgi:hypothetical protein
MKSGVIATLRLLFARQAKGKRKLVLWRCYNNRGDRSHRTARDVTRVTDRTRSFVSNQFASSKCGSPPVETHTPEAKSLTEQGGTS